MATAAGIFRRRIQEGAAEWSCDAEVAVERAIGAPISDAEQAIFLAIWNRLEDAVCALLAGEPTSPPTLRLWAPLSHAAHSGVHLHAFRDCGHLRRGGAFEALDVSSVDVGGPRGRQVFCWLADGRRAYLCQFCLARLARGER